MVQQGQDSAAMLRQAILNDVSGWRDILMVDGTATIHPSAPEEAYDLRDRVLHDGPLYPPENIA